MLHGRAAISAINCHQCPLYENRVDMDVQFQVTSSALGTSNALDGVDKSSNLVEILPAKLIVVSVRSKYQRFYKEAMP